MFGLLGASCQVFLGLASYIPGSCAPPVASHCVILYCNPEPGILHNASCGYCKVLVSLTFALDHEASPGVWGKHVSLASHTGIMCWVSRLKSAACSKPVCSERSTRECNQVTTSQACSISHHLPECRPRLCRFRVSTKHSQAHDLNADPLAQTMLAQTMLQLYKNGWRRLVLGLLQRTGCS